MAASRRSFEECSAAVEAAGKIGKKAALELLSEVYNRAETMKLTGQGDPYLMAVSDLADTALADAQKAKLDSLRNAAARTEMRSRADTEAEGRVTGGVSAHINIFKQNLGIVDGLRSIFHYIPAASRHDNVEGMWVGLARQLISPIGNRLRQLALEKAALVDGLRSEVAEAMWRKNGGTPNQAIAISKNAQAIADAFWEPLQRIKERQNALGANIGDAIDYVTHTAWSPRQLQLAAGPGAAYEDAFQAWRTRDVPRMAEKTFEDVLPREGETAQAARERFIRSLYDATRSGVHMRGTNMAGFDGGGLEYIPPAYEGTSNIAKAASHQRVVYWKNAQAWADHQFEFGGGHSLYYDIVHTLDVGARRTALMHYAGTNPGANFETIAQRLEEQYRTSPELKQLQNQLRGLRNVIGRLDGSLNMPVSEAGALLTEQLMSVEAATHLGGVSITHMMAAPATFSSEMVHHGVGHLQTVMNLLTAAGRGTAERQEALADTGAYTHGYLGALQRTGSMGEVWQRDGVPGFVSWAAAHFHHLTGLSQILDALQANGVKSVLMSRLGRYIDGAFADIEEHQQNALTHYGIGQDEWQLIRSSSEPSMVEGSRWVTPSDALHSDAAQVEALLRSRGELGDKASASTIDTAVKKFQWELGDKLLMYLNDASDRGAVRPGVREKGIMLQGTKPGEPLHFAARAVSQFKMWPLAATMQIIGRDIAMSLNKKEMAANFGILVALSTLGGAARMAVNDAATGRPQRDYANPMTLLAAAAQGGGLGIYGDFLFGETSRMQQGLASTFAGPIVGDVERMWNIFTRWKADMRTSTPGKAFEHMWPDLAHLFAQHVPFANLIYLKGTLDYLLWYHLFEAASPGWWERTNQRLQKEQGRAMVGYRPGGGIPQHALWHWCPMTHEERSAAREAKRQANKEAWARNEAERREKRQQDKAGIRKPAARQRGAPSTAAKAAKRVANREAWMSSPRNTNTMWKLRREAELVPMPDIVIDQMASGSSSLAMLRAVMADTASPIYRRLDAADVIIDYELAPGAAANVPPDQLASSAYQFYRQVAAAEDTPEGLKFRAMKAIARVENSRKAAAQSPEAHFAQREFHRRLVNASRSQALRSAGTWEAVVSTGARWALDASDTFEVPVLPDYIEASIEKLGVAAYLDIANRHQDKEQCAAERAQLLLAVRATNRVDDWDHLLGGDHA